MSLPDLYATRRMTDQWLADDALAEIKAWAEMPLRHPEQADFPAVAYERIRQIVWAYRCELRDRRAARRELSEINAAERAARRDCPPAEREEA